MTLWLLHHARFMFVLFPREMRTVVGPSYRSNWRLISKGMDWITSLFSTFQKGFSASQRVLFFGVGEWSMIKLFILLGWHEMLRFDIYETDVLGHIHMSNCYTFPNLLSYIGFQCRTTGGMRGSALLENAARKVFANEQGEIHSASWFVVPYDQTLSMPQPREVRSGISASASKIDNSVGVLRESMISNADFLPDCVVFAVRSAVSWSENCCVDIPLLKSMVYNSAAAMPWETNVCSIVAQAKKHTKIRIAIYAKSVLASCW